MRAPFAWLLWMAILIAVPAGAENFDLYNFDSPQEAERFERLTAELRCPKCQNQSIADSNAPIAQDLRQRTFELMKEGRSDEEIVTWLTERYGEFITYRPAFNVVNLLLWLGPFVLLAGVAGVLIVVLRRRSSAALAESRDPADTTARAEEILARYRERDRGDGGPSA